MPGREDAVLGPDVEEAPAPPAPVRGVDFLAAGLRGTLFFPAASPEAEDFADLGDLEGFGVLFFVAAFHEVPQVRQDTSVRALYVSHSEQRQSADGHPAPPGRLAGGRGAPVFFAAGLDAAGLAAVRLDVAGPDAAGPFAAERAPAVPGLVGVLGAGLAGESRRASPQTVQDASAGPLNVSQSAQRQLADATSCSPPHSSLVLVAVPGP